MLKSDYMNKLFERLKVILFKEKYGLFKNPYYAITQLSYGTFFERWCPDKLYIKLLYRSNFGFFPNLKEPKTFNEKLNWMKLYYHQDHFSKMVDKIAVKEYVSNLIGSEYVIPTIATYESFSDINLDDLPARFVLKCNHDSGTLAICKDKEHFCLSSYKGKFEKGLKRNYYYPYREWPYKNVQPKIFAEKYIGDENEQLVTYKFFCFSGRPEIVQVVYNDKQSDECIDYFSTEWKLLTVTQNYPNSEIHCNRPEKLSQMLDICSKLSANMPFIRIDLYETGGGKIYFSEFTFYSDAGLVPFNPPEWDLRLGKLISLPLESIK